MELATALKGQSIQNRIRVIGINPNYCCSVEWTNQGKPSEITPITVWRRAIAHYRDIQAGLHALNEQRPDLANPNRRYVELNPTIMALQRVIIGQYEKFMQQFRQLSNRTNGGNKASFPWLRWLHGSDS